MFFFLSEFFRSSWSKKLIRACLSNLCPSNFTYLRFNLKLRRGETISLEVYLIEPTSSIYSHIFNIYHNVSFEYVNKLSPILIRLKNEMRFSLQKSNRVNI